MRKEEYLKLNFKAFNEGKISAEAFDAALINMEDFIEEEDDFFSSLKDEIEKGDHSPFNEDFRD